MTLSQVQGAIIVILRQHNGGHPYGFITTPDTVNKLRREDKRYTYGVYSRFAQPNDVGAFHVIGDVNQHHVGDAVQEIPKELKGMQDKPLTDQELADVKGMLEGGFALALEPPGDYANQLAPRYLTGVPLSELNSMAPLLQFSLWGMIVTIRPTKENKYTGWPTSYRRKINIRILMVFCGSLNSSE